MNSENQKDTQTSAKKRTALLILKITGIVLSAVLGVLLLISCIFYLVFNIMYSNGIYDTSVPNVQEEQQMYLPDWDELDPVLIGVRVTKETTEYNVMKTNPAKEEYTSDISAKAIYYIDGKIIEKDAETAYISVENNMLTTVGDKKITVRIVDSYGGTLPTAYKNVYIPIKVVDDNSANENSPFETETKADTYMGSSENALWSILCSEEYDLIKNMNLAPIIDVPQKDSDIINVLILGTADNTNEPELERKKLETIMIASYNVSTKAINIISIHNQFMGVMDKKVYPLAGVYAIGGPGAVINSVNAVFDTDIQYYVEINLDSFVAFINKLGGVSVNITEEEIEALMLEDVTAGEAILSGENAEKYLTDNGNDITGINKTDRQRKFLSGLFDKLLNMQSLKAFETVAANTKFVQTNLPFSTLAKYVIRTGFGLSDITFSRHFTPYGEYGKDYTYVVYGEKYRVYYANTEYLREETEKIMGYSK